MMALAVFFCGVATGLAEALAQKTKPYFVIIFIDDMGYGDIEPFGSQQNKTPNLNGELYNLNADLGEKNNVAGTNPEVVRRLRIMLKDFVADIKANSRPVGIAPNSRTLVPRPGIEGEEGYRPTLSLQGKKK